MSSRPLRVLLVDDNEALRENLVECLETEGHEVIEARNGAEALERVVRTVPDVVLLDLVMPGIDGREVAAALRRRPELALARIVLMTGTSAGDLPDVPEVDAVLEKPFPLSRLFAEVEKARERRPSLG